MGQIKNILYQKKIEPKCEFYNDKMSCETDENLHMHWKNIRLEFGKRDWVSFCEAITKAYNEWIRIGKPALNKKDDIVNNTVYLPHPTDIEPVSEFYPERYQIEEQANVPTVHIHYRELRLELGMSEFKEFAKGMKEALNKLEGGNNE